MEDEAVDNVKNFNVRVVAQSVSTLTFEWDADAVPTADVYEIEKHHKRLGWQRVAWTCACRGTVQHLDDNFAYRFRINALKLAHETGCHSERDNIEQNNENNTDNKDEKDIKKAKWNVEESQDVEDTEHTEDTEECNCDKLEYITLAVSEEVVGMTESMPPSTMCLYRAIKKGQQFLIKRILRRRPSLIDYPAQNGYLPLANAITMGELSIIDIILTAGASVHIGNPINGRTPLHVAFSQGHLPVARMLLNKKADINVKDNNRMTPCHGAVDANQYDMLRFALDNGADMEALDLPGWTLLLRAVMMRSDMAIVKLLHQHGANLKAVDATGVNCVQLARLFGNDEALRYLEKCVR